MAKETQFTKGNQLSQESDSDDTVISDSNPQPDERQDVENGSAPIGQCSYAQRGDSPDGVYYRLESIFNDPQFVGHPECFAGVAPVSDANGNVTWMKEGKPHQAILIGEMASDAEGTKLSARGNMYPAQDPVSQFPIPCIRR